MTKFKLTLKNTIFGYKSEYILTESEMKLGGLRKILNRSIKAKKMV